LDRELHRGRVHVDDVAFPAVPDWNVAIHQGMSIGYRAGINANFVDILNLSTFAVSGTFPAGPSISGRMLTDPAGTRLFLSLQNGFSIVTLP
jgi:hypothetical protein